ncbi:SH3 domain-containing protein [Treponema primitia]|uniref:SH3 domain-containing protein n=1 Tax=Treponema primitia TaxID=88058 RepID=UPI0005A067B8|nr:SH3 domain-containing protein [Treponema primitia]
MRSLGLARLSGFFLCILLGVLLSSCSRLLGWGVLLWSTEDPPIPSGTVLPVYIRSNIDHVWVVGIPEAYRITKGTNKFEIPVWQLELAGGKKAAEKRAAEFAEYARLYAETAQDGLPIRDDPDNSARRVYRLRMGEIIKVLARVEGNPAISTTGDPLPGDWYRVLTEDGSTGYCFSYRLKLFEHTGGALRVVPAAAVEDMEDPDLDMVLSNTWYPDWYGAMVSSRRVDLEDLQMHWRFLPNPDTGVAQIYLPNMDLSFSYTGIERTRNRAWRFEGAPLQMNLQSDTVLTVQYTENGGALKALVFVTLPMDLGDLIAQETERRETLLENLYALGPVFQSTNYGTLSFLRNGAFTWTGNNILIPQVIPASALGSGTVNMGLFLDTELEERYTGAFTLHFDGISSSGIRINFMYSSDEQGLRIEYVPPENLNGITVLRRAASPRVIYFFKADRQGITPAQPVSPLEF